MNVDINLPTRPVSDSIHKAQQSLATFIQESYISKSNPEERVVDIRDDGRNGCSSVIYFQEGFTQSNVHVLAGEQLTIAVKDDPVLDWINDMPWEHAVWVVDQNALQLHCAPIEMSNGESSDVFAIQLPVKSGLVKKARALSEGKLVRFTQDKASGSLKIQGQVKKVFPVTDIS